MEKLNTFFFENLSSLFWISFFRISIGIFILLHFISVLPDFNVLYSMNGIIPSDISDVFIPTFIITVPKIIIFFQSIGIDAYMTIIVFQSLYALLCISIILGILPRMSAFLLLILQIALVKSNPYYAYGVDFFTSMSLFYLILIPSNFEYAFKPTEKINISVYKRLFQIHISIAYFFSGFDKIIGYNWWNGESIWKAINLPFANSNFDFSFLANHPSLLIMIGWGTIMIEILYPLFIWIERTRRIWVILTISLHIGIAFILNLYFFSVIMIIWNLTLFYTFNTKEYNEKLVIFYDNWCPNCKRFIKLIQIGDWFNQIEYRQLRNADDIVKYPTIDLELAKEQMSSYLNEWKYGYASLYAIFLRIPLLWILVPFFYVLKLSGAGQYLYMQLALKRNIIPLHCTENSCVI